MTLSDLLDGAFAVIKCRPRTVFTIAAVILVPVHLITAFAQRNNSIGASIDNLTNTLNTGQSTGTSDSQVFSVYAASALAALALFFLGGAIGRLVSAWYAGGDVTASEALRASFRRTPALVAAFAMLLPLKVLGLCGFYVGALVPVTLFSLTAPAMVIEGLGPVNGARRSWRLIARRFWFCILVVLLAVRLDGDRDRQRGGVDGGDDRAGVDVGAALPRPADPLRGARHRTAGGRCVRPGALSRR
jgi:hypothetical protein